jgi:hypothetical protein
VPNHCFLIAKFLKKIAPFGKNLNFVKVPRTGETTLLFAWQLIGCRTARDRFR